MVADTSEANIETFILTKFNSLVDVVGEINERIKTLKDEMSQLSNRLDTVERSAEANALAKNELDGADVTAVAQRTATLSPNEQLSYNPSNIERELPTPWLLSAPLKTSIASLQVLLDLETHNTTEVDALDWHREEDMWYNLLENLPENIEVIPPDSVTIGSLRRVARGTILRIIGSKLLLCIHNVPGEGTQRTGSQNLTLTLIAILITAIAEGWARYQTTNKCIGKLFVVLLGDNVGRQMRAGSRLLTIHELG